MPELIGITMVVVVVGSLAGPGSDAGLPDGSANATAARVDKHGHGSRLAGSGPGGHGGQHAMLFGPATSAFGGPRAGARHHAQGVASAIASRGSKGKQAAVGFLNKLSRAPLNLQVPCCAAEDRCMALAQPACVSSPLIHVHVRGGGTCAGGLTTRSGPSGTVRRGSIACCRHACVCTKNAASEREDASTTGLHTGLDLVHNASLPLLQWISVGALQHWRSSAVPLLPMRQGRAALLC